MTELSHSNDINLLSKRTPIPVLRITDIHKSGVYIFFWALLELSLHLPSSVVYDLMNRHCHDTWESLPPFSKATYLPSLPNPGSIIFNPFPPSTQHLGRAGREHHVVPPDWFPGHSPCHSGSSLHRICDTMYPAPSCWECRIEMKTCKTLGQRPYKYLKKSSLFMSYLKNIFLFMFFPSS